MWYVVRTTSHDVLTFLVFLLMVSSFAMAKPRSGKRSPSSASVKEKDPFLCDPDKLMVYKVTLATHWSRTLFPKQYPEWRPPAQWSKVIGKLISFIYFIFLNPHYRPFETGIYYLFFILLWPFICC